MNKFLLIGSLAVAAMMASCGSKVQTVPVDELSGEWKVQTIDGKAITVSADSDTAFIAFDVKNNKVFGMAGCNRVMGTLAATDEGIIDFSSLIATRMMCPDMSVEDALMAALAKVEKFGVNNSGELVLSDKAGAELVTLAKSTTTMSPAVLEGVWKVTYLGTIDLTETEGEGYTVEFLADGIFAMNTGCNAINGSYSGKFVDIKFDNLLSTLMMCPDMTVEDTAKAVLPEITSFSEGDGMAVFYNAENDVVMVLVRE